MSDAPYSTAAPPPAPAPRVVDLLHDSITLPGTSARASKSGRVVAVILGAILLIGGTGALLWNEQRAAAVARTLAEGSQTVQEGSPERVHAIQDGKLIHVASAVSIPGTLVDPDVPAVRAPHAAVLRRLVETYQWRESENSKRGGGTTYRYNQDWYEEIIDSSQFHERAGHQNVPPLFRSNEMTAPRATLGVRLVSAALLSKLEGGEALMPDRARLPPGTRINEDSLYLGSNPDDPAIGDQRLRWTAVTPAELSVLGGQHGAELVPYRAQTGGELALITAGLKSAVDMVNQAEMDEEKYSWTIRGFAALAMLPGFILLLVWFSAEKRPAPIVGEVPGFAPLLAGLGLTLILASLMIGVSLALTVPVRGAVVLAAGWVIGWPMIWVNRARQARRRRRLAVAAPAAA